MDKRSTISPDEAPHPPDQSAKAHVVAVLTDLMFDSRIRSTAEALDLNYRSVRSLERLSEYLDSRPGAIVIVDMEVNAISARDAIAQSVAQKPKPTVVAYYPHVQTELRHQAVEAGADLIMPRSRFSAEISDILAAHGQAVDQNPAGASS